MSKKEKTSEKTKEKEECPYCGKMYERLDLHKCKEKPKEEKEKPKKEKEKPKEEKKKTKKINKEKYNINWRHCKDEPEYIINEGKTTQFILKDDTRFDDFAHDVQSALNFLRKPVRSNRNKRIVELVK